MNLVPTLGLGPRRLARRPVETLLLVLAVALGTAATVIAVDALVGILHDLDQTARAPWVRMIEVWDQDQEKWTAVMSDERYTAASRRFDHVGDYSAWVDKVRRDLPGLETAYFDFGAAAQVRVADGPWTQAGRSFCAQPTLFDLPSVALVAGRFPTRREFDEGVAGLVIGENLLAALLPGVTPAAALGRDLEVNRNFWEPRVDKARIVGVCRKAPGTGPDVNGDPGDWLALGRRVNESWGQATFVARSVEEVPALVARLKVLVAQDPEVRSMDVTDRYFEYEQRRTLARFAAVLTLGVGAGTLLIALWTLGSVFRARIPGLRKARTLLTALGADGVILLGMDLSEILPVSLGGLVLGAVAAVGFRVGVLGTPVVQPHDAFLVLGLALVAVGLPFAQVRVPRAPHPRQAALRLVSVVLSLTLGLAGTSMALSLARDLSLSIPKLGAPLPQWAGLVRSQQDDTHYLDDGHRISSADLANVGRRLAPGDWSPVMYQTGQMESTTVTVPSLQGRRFWIRNKTLGRASLVSIFGLTLVAGRLPGEDPGTKPQVLVSEEVAEGLFGSGAASLGQVIVDNQPAGPPGGAAYQVAGVYTNPSGPQADLGAPDLVFVPGPEFWARPTTGYAGILLAFHPGSAAATQGRDAVVSMLNAAHPGATAQGWSGGRERTMAPDWATGIQASARANLAVVVLLAGLFLVVSCLGVLGDLFVRITSRAHAIAVERALGRPFGHFVGRAFFRGAGLVVGSAVLAVATATLALPVLATSLTPYLGDLLVRSTGRVDLDLATMAAVTLAAALLAGAIATLPLLPYRKIPLSTQIGGHQ